MFFDPKIERVEIYPLTPSEIIDRVDHMLSCEAVENEDERSIPTQTSFPEGTPYAESIS